LTGEGQRGWRGGRGERYILNKNPGRKKAAGHGAGFGGAGGATGGVGDRGGGGGGQKNTKKT